MSTMSICMIIGSIVLAFLFAWGIVAGGAEPRKEDA